MLLENPGQNRCLAPHLLSQGSGMNKALKDLQAGRDPFAAPEEESGNPNIVYGAAKWCVWLPILAWILSWNVDHLTKGMTGPWIHWAVQGAGIVARLSMVGGVVLAIIALCGISKYGRQGLFWRGTFGLTLNLVFIASVVVSNFERTMKNAVALQKLEGAANQIRADAKKDFNRKHELTLADSQKGIEAFKTALDSASQNATGDEALLVKATGAYLEKVQKMNQEYAAAVKSLREPPVLDMSAVNQQTQLQTKKETVKNFLAANEKLETFVVNSENLFRQELEKLNIPAKVVNATMEGFHSKMAARNSLMVKIREDDKRFGAAMLGMLVVLDTNWGKWNYNPERKKVVFEEDTALDQYMSYRNEMDAAGREQTQLQGRLVNLASD